MTDMYQWKKDKAHLSVKQLLDFIEDEMQTLQDIIDDEYYDMKDAHIRQTKENIEVLKELVAEKTR